MQILLHVIVESRRGTGEAILQESASGAGLEHLRAAVAEAVEQRLKAVADDSGCYAEFDVLVV